MQSVAHLLVPHKVECDLAEFVVLVLIDQAHLRSENRGSRIGIPIGREGDAAKYRISTITLDDHAFPPRTSPDSLCEDQTEERETWPGDLAETGSVRGVILGVLNHTAQAVHRHPVL
jgi:hypothetical protein